jgi:tetratricopeptide (TPR) repeat protein
MLPQLQAQLRKEPSLRALGPLFTKENSERLFELVVESRLPVKQTNSTLDELFELCGSDSDRDLNLLANILKQKGLNHTRTQNLPAAIDSFEQAVATILLMEAPDHLTLSQLYKFVGDLYVQLGELKKAEKSLKEAQHVLAGVQGEDLKFLPAGLACIHTQLCMIHYRERRPMEALEELGKALKDWEAVPKKILQEYELTCRLKCMLHILFQEKEQALQTAKHFM